MRVADLHGLGNAGIIRRYRPGALCKILLRFFANRDHLRVFPCHRRGSTFEHIAVIAACQTAVARDHDKQAVLHLALPGIDRVCTTCIPGNPRNGLIQRMEIRPHSQYALFGTPHFGRGHQFHRLGDLHGGLHGFDRRLISFMFPEAMVQSSFRLSARKGI